MKGDLEWKRYEKQIAGLSALEFNYDADLYHQSHDRTGWHIDHYVASLGYEEPGEPGAPFHAVQKAIRLYRFPDPSLIRGEFDPDHELNGRNMFMVAHFLGMRFTFGVRVTSVIDEERVSASGERSRAWGYAYRTLRGHFEIGEIRFEASKNLASGEIAFQIDAYSKPDRIPNWFYRTGFRVFGRRLQLRFAKSSIRRLTIVAREAGALAQKHAAKIIPMPTTEAMKTSVLTTGTPST